MSPPAVLHGAVFRARLAAGEPDIAGPHQRLQERAVLKRLRAGQRSRHRPAFENQILLVKRRASRLVIPDHDPGPSYSSSLLPELARGGGPPKAVEGPS